MTSGDQVAILIDGGFFLKRLAHLQGTADTDSPEKVARWVRRLMFNHVMRLKGGSAKLWQQHLYRGFFYDAHPFDGKAHHPVDNKPIDYAKSLVATQRIALFQQLRQVRKLALRLGKVNRDSDWTLAPRKTKAALKTRHQLEPLRELETLLEQAAGAPIQLTLSSAQAQQLHRAFCFWRDLQVGDVFLGLRQKGVDMRIAIDIASLSLKKQVKTIVLVAGDSDFVPAAKLARREGIEFILDPLWQSVNDDLFEHIDALQSGLKKPSTANNHSTHADVAATPLSAP